MNTGFDLPKSFLLIWIFLCVYSFKHQREIIISAGSNSYVVIIHSSVALYESVAPNKTLLEIVFCLIFYLWSRSCFDSVSQKKSTRSIIYFLLTYNHVILHTFFTFICLVLSVFFSLLLARLGELWRTSNHHGPQINSLIFQFLTNLHSHRHAAFSLASPRPSSRIHHFLDTTKWVILILSLHMPKPR